MIVVYGREEVELDATEAMEVGAIYRRLKSFMGLPASAVAIVDGTEVNFGHLVRPGSSSTLEFRVKRGKKAVGKIWTAEEYCGLFGLTPEDFEIQIREGLRVMRNANGVLVTETAVDNFIAGLNGGGDGGFLALIAKSLEKIANRLDLPQDRQREQINGTGDYAPAHSPQPKRKSPYMDSKEAADYLGISAKSLYAQVERRHIIPLRGPRGKYRFTSKMLDEYLRRQQ